MKKFITLRLATAAQEIPPYILTMTYRQFLSMENGGLHTKTVRHIKVRANPTTCYWSSQATATKMVIKRIAITH